MNLPNDYRIHTAAEPRSPIAKRDDPGVLPSAAPSGSFAIAASITGDQAQFVEEVGLLFETIGFPRMAGRVLGWLLISNPSHQSHGELAKVLQASKGSISTMTRLLEQIGLIERISLPGQRRDYFRIRLNAWSELSKRRLDQIAAFRHVAERGLSLLQAEPPERTQRLQEMHDIHAFFEAELPRMLDRWEHYRVAQSPPQPS